MTLNINTVITALVATGFVVVAATVLLPIATDAVNAVNTVAAAIR